MKKFIALTLTVLALITLVVALSACNTCEHEYGEWTVTTEATCNKPGQRERACLSCGEKETQEIKVTSTHTYGEWETITAPSCVAKGEEKRVCSVCGDTEKKEIAINENGHSFGEWNVIREATCSRQGEKERTCSLCDTTEKVIINKPTEGGHTYGEWQISIEPTCSKEGQRVKLCKDCESPVYETLSPLDEGGHSYGEGYITKDPTCVGEGEMTYDCVYCDEKKTEVVAPLEDGGHSFGDWVVSVEPTCSTEGEKKRQCGLCQSFEIETLSPLDEGGHAFGDWVITIRPTCDTEGEEKRECGLCEEFETQVVDKLPIVYTITVSSDGSTWVVNIPEDGIYSLSAPTKLGYTFTGWFDGENSFPADGMVTESKEITARFELTPTLTFSELKARIEGGVDKILLGDNITLTDTIYVTKETTITSNGDYTLTRSANFLGDLFIMGEDETGRNVILSGDKAIITIKPEEGKTITIDGNRDNVTGAVKGSVFFMLNGSVLNIYDGVAIKNNLKLGNEKILDPRYAVADNTLIGGSVAIIDDGTFNMYGGEISNNAVNLKYASSTPEEERVEGYRDSSYGGAIYSVGAINVYGGLFESNEASYGGAIFSTRTLNIQAGTISNNYASSYGGAIFGSNNGSMINYIGSDEGDKKEIKVIFSGNSAKGGGAIYQQYNNATVIYGNTLFEDNKALGKNGGAMSTGGELIIYYAEFKNNIAADRGGALYGTYSEAEKAVRVIDIKEALFEGNSAARGGALGASATADAEESGAIIELGNVTFKNNTVFKTESSTPTFIDNVDREGVERNYNGNGAVAHFTAKCELHLYGNVVFEGNVAPSKGGALYLTNQAKVKSIEGAQITFIKNESGSYGGAIYATNNSEVNLSEATFEENSGYRGGAITALGGSVVTLNNVNATANTSSSAGGFAYLELSEISITGESKLVNNESTGSSAGVFYLEGSKLSLTGSEGAPIVISGNASKSQGGVICAYIASVTTTTTDESTGETTEETETIRSNITVNYVSFDSNKANVSTQYGGGAIYASNTDVTIDNSVFNANEAVYGGAISLYSGAVLTASNTSFTNNTADANGGVMYTSKSTATFENIIVNGNKVTGYDTTETVTDEETGETTTVDKHIDGNGGAFFFNSSSEATFSGVSASGNTAEYGGFIYIGNKASVTVSGGTNEFTENTASKNGGAFFVGESTSLTLTGIKASRNTAENGGAIYVNEAALFTVNGDKNEFIENIGTSENDQYGAGAIYIYKTQATISNTVFDKNTGNCGGAVGIRATSAGVEFNSCTFTDNEGAGTGGTFYLNTSTVTINNSIVTGSVSGKNGGAIYSTTGTVNTNNSIFRSNSAVGNYGGTFYMTKTTYNSKDDTFESNTAKHGGAIAINSNSVATVIGSNFKTNVATGNGGAIWLGSKSLDITSSEISGNTANLGGGIFVTGASTTLVGNELTVASNEATENSTDGYGGGIHIAGGATVTITDLTLNNNTASYGGGIGLIGGSTLTINGISAKGNEATGYTTTDDAGTVTINSGNGGAINAGEGSLTIGKGTKILSNVFEENVANSGGGAIYIYNTTTTFVANEIVATSNEAKTNYGGALYIRGANITANIGTLTLTSNKAGGNGGGAYFYAFKGGKIGTIVANDNSTKTAGGAIYIAGSAEIEIDSVSGSGNTATTNGGFAYIGANNVTIKSGEIGENTDKNGKALHFTAAVKIYTDSFTYPEGSINDASKITVMTDAA